MVMAVIGMEGELQFGRMVEGKLCLRERKL